MENLPDSLYEDYSQLRSTWSTGSSSTPALPTVISRPNLATILQWINDLHCPMNSDFALQNLANNIHDFERLPLLLWDSPGIVSMLLQEIVSVYRIISLPFFHPWIRVRVYNILLLFQGIACHPETRVRFLKARMPHYFYPLMDLGYTDRPREWIRLGALGVIAHMLKPRTEEGVIRFLVDSGALGHCTRPIELGSTDSKTLAVFIISRVLSTNQGLKYCCVMADRFFVIHDLLKMLLVYLSRSAKPSPTLFSLITSCYQKLSKKARACIGIRNYIPILLFDGTFTKLLAEDPVANNYRMELIENLENSVME